MHTMGWHPAISLIKPDKSMPSQQVSVKFFLGIGCMCNSLTWIRPVFREGVIRQKKGRPLEACRERLAPGTPSSLSLPPCCCCTCYATVQTNITLWHNLRCKHVDTLPVSTHMLQIKSSRNSLVIVYCQCLVIVTSGKWPYSTCGYPLL